MTDQIIVNPSSPNVIVVTPGSSASQGTLVVGTGQGGAVGPAGPAGPAGKDGVNGLDGLPGGAFIYNQGSPATVWTIVHNLGFRPQVSVVDSANIVVEGDYSYPDANTMVLTFSSAFSGVAYLS
jgi:hypothetical protein